MVDVFISYSRSNQEVVRRLAEAVKRLGYDLWWDDELPPHRSYAEVITEKIGEAKAAIVVWSGGSIGSEWVRAEADLARNQKKLIQTAIDDCMPPMPFNQIQFASLADWTGEDDHPGWSKVKGSLAALCGPPTDVRAVYPLPDAPPPAAPPLSRGTRPAPASMPVPARPAPRRPNLLLGALIGGSLVVIAGVGLLALGRGGDQSAAQPRAESGARPSLPDGDVLGDKPPPPAMPARPPAAVRGTAAAQARPAPRRAAPTPARQPQRQAGDMPMRARRWCMGPGRGTPQCMQMMRRRRAAY